MKFTSLFLSITAISFFLYSCVTGEDKAVVNKEKKDTYDVALFNEFFVPHYPLAFINHRLAGIQSVLRRLSPRYEIVEDETKFEVAIDVPGFKFHEIVVELRSGNRVLSISGEHDSQRNERTVTSQFMQSFTLDPSIDTEKMKANLVDGVLLVTAPRHRHVHKNRRIPVTQFDKDVLDEMREEEELERAFGSQKDEE
mmetsp:Transcript_6413/g.8672  ORF Transcript_6413/g.8672 Transcript_6413/m.8672 type:complete len:197 (-) Transcript_6413:138-728(-)|eukprot:CAMPEP_0185729436 /NCGR_PEP_ID=MMETSP1171-20130828/5715_1 /TAXON_ID=374046 /ORGANISM="Helicotheca tamensis, Strain CCMP826" /LENGTH=196 /DNA_ID=CAMNT_0028398273 /DNA_START=119 /DNA_END=709 /DNA_ORIENTATION=-